MTGGAGTGAGLPALLALVAFVAFRFLQSLGASPFVTGTAVLLAGLLLLAALRSLIDDWRWYRLLAAMKLPTGLHGRLAFPDAGDADRMGLSFTNEDGNGIPLGSAGDRIIYWDGKGHASFRAPTEGGKTESSAATICFALGAHRNIIATGKGPELAWLVGPYRRDVLKQAVRVIGPWELMRDHGMEYAHFNPVGHLVKYADAQNPELIDKARACALILLPEPEGASGENKFFRSLGRDLLAWCLVYLALREADTGELCCNLANLYEKICGSDAELNAFFGEMRQCPDFVGTVRKAADRFIGKITRSPKLGESILTEAQDAIQIYDPAGVLGQRSQYSDFDPADLKTPGKPTSIFFELPPEKIQTHGKHFGLCLNTLIDVCIEADRFEPRVTVVADEFTNMCDGPLPSALTTLFIGRSRGVHLTTYVQDVESYYARYGKEASAFTSQSEVVMAWGIRSIKDAKEYSERSGLRSTMTETGSLPVGKTGGNYSLGLSEKGIPHYRPDEFLQLPDFTAALFYRQNPPVIVDLVSYRMVEPWRSHARPVPGAPPSADVPVRFRL